MILDWFNAGEASAAAISLADEFARAPRGAKASPPRSGANEPDRPMRELLARLDRQMENMRLNFYKRAKFANSFKWRLIEKGVDRALADQVTQTVVMHLSMTGSTGTSNDQVTTQPKRLSTNQIRRLLDEGNKHLASGDTEKAQRYYEEVLQSDEDNAHAQNNMASVQWRLGHHVEAEQTLRQLISAHPDFADANANLGNLLRRKGHFSEAETFYRRAIKIKPNHLDAHGSLGHVLVILGQFHEARARFRKVLKALPGKADALFGLGQIAAMEGDFPEAEALYRRALDSDEGNASALAGLASLRKMSTEDRAWLERSEALVNQGLTAQDEAALRFALGKYYDDVEDYTRAFENFERANDLMKSLAEPYAAAEQKRFVDDTMRIYSRAAISRIGTGGSDATLPVFVVGMPRSGTSLVEQIISSHPQARGAGELAFWLDTARRRDAEISKGLLSDPVRQQLAADYLKVLTQSAATNAAGNILRVVDKATINSDYLGVIHSVLPRAKFIYMRRDPVDVCLSCYFQQLPVALNYTLDLKDLAHYYRQHERLASHWKSVLPAGVFLEVPYEDLVADQEAWTRRIIDFVGLDWDERCLSFHETKRSVVTSSFWQVRQRIYRSSVERWRHYEPFLGPLRALKGH